MLAIERHHKMEHGCETLDCIFAYYFSLFFLLIDWKCGVKINVNATTRKLFLDEQATAERCWSNNKTNEMIKKKGNKYKIQKQKCISTKFVQLKIMFTLCVWCFNSDRRTENWEHTCTCCLVPFCTFYTCWLFGLVASALIKNRHTYVTIHILWYMYGWMWTRCTVHSEQCEWSSGSSGSGLKGYFFFRVCSWSKI